MAQKISLVRGMRDVLPKEQKYWSLIKQASKKRLQSFGFLRIDTPIIESKELFLRGAGESSDIVEKELYGVSRVGTRSNNEDGQEIKDVLRPEGTASIIRSYIENGMHTWAQPVKLYSLMPLFRYDRPQKGRYRQHTQLSVEIIGDAEPLTDAMAILALWQIIQDVKIDNSSIIELNSIGDKECRSKITKKITAYYKPLLPHLCENCQRRFHENPMRLLDCKESECQKYRAGAPRIIDIICKPCRDHFMSVLEYLDAAGVMYSLNPYLVRGLDYYSRTVFEIKDTLSDTQQSSLGGGGRYDYLVKTLGGKQSPAFGFGIGIERLVEKLMKSGIEVPEEEGTSILIIQLGKRAKRKAIPLLVSLAKQGLSASMALGKESLKAQLKSADKMNAKFTLIVGEREAIDNTIICRNMIDGSQETVPFEDVEQVVKRRLAEMEE